MKGLERFDVNTVKNFYFSMFLMKYPNSTPVVSWVHSILKFLIIIVDNNSVLSLRSLSVLNSCNTQYLLVKHNHPFLTQSIIYLFFTQIYLLSKNRTWNLFLFQVNPIYKITFFTSVSFLSISTWRRTS